MSHPSSPLVPHHLPIHMLKENAAMNNAINPSASVPRTGMAPLLGPENSLCECPFCNASIKTAVQYSNTSRTHIAAALWCMVCCLCCVPYCSESAKNADHYCPSCRRYLGTYKK